ncbi:MAG: CDP-glycerol glycerophosphotransferase family protein [Gammaproteobacteria bacterium]
MKIDKSNPAHWLCLLLFAVNVVAALLLRPFLARRGPALVLLYGHKLNGNLARLYEVLEAAGDADLEFAFLSMDRAYCRQLAAAGRRVACALSPAGILALARVRAIVSDHGLHVMTPLPRLTRIRFADVWHGVPYKGWDRDDFRKLHGYDEVWVSSSTIARFYTERFGFRPEQVVVTGYGRTDPLILGSHDTAAIRLDIGAPPAPAPLVLFAPTWQHEDRARSIFPFGVEAGAFLAEVGGVLERHGARGLLRTHLNSRVPLEPGGPFLFVPQDRFPDSEAVLAVSDVLICDWSSIAFDFLVLGRPTIFLDVPPPFSKGFTLGPEYRFGAIAGDLAALVRQLDAFLTSPEAYRSACAERIEQAMRAAYDDFADGHAGERYRERLLGLIDRGSA